jgi:glutathione peroxidase
MSLCAYVVKISSKPFIILPRIYNFISPILFPIKTITMKYLLTLAAVVMLSAFTMPSNTSIHSFKVKSIDGGMIDFAKYKGKKILVVNVASQCGYTRQYEGLQKLYDAHKDKLVIVGFPANNFGSQEPGSDGEIAQFCKARFGVTFPMASKISVKGDDTAPIYKWLTSKTENGVLDASIGWNFNKFLLDENGKMIAYFPSKIEPNSEEITKWLK